ncbi:MAG: hypothetical protein ACKOYO_04035 [Actinomycetota bacterium]
MKLETKTRVVGRPPGIRVALDPSPERVNAIRNVSQTRRCPSMAGRNELHPEVERVREWLTTTEAVAYSTARTSRSNLPLSAEGLRDEALFSVWQMFERNPDREPLENIAAYMKTVMRTLCAGREPEEVPTPPESLEKIGGEANRPSGPKRDDDVLQARTLVEIGPGRDEAKAAVLNVLTLTDPAIERSDLPRPHQGAKPEHARWWPAIFLASRNPELFPQPGSSDSAQRQRLSRFMKECEQVLNAAKFTFEKGTN